MPLYDVISRVTGGPEGSSVCGRLHLFKMFVNDTNPIVNALVSVIDSFDEHHCLHSAQAWRRRVRKDWRLLKDIPAVYKPYFTERPTANRRAGMSQIDW